MAATDSACPPENECLGAVATVPIPTSLRAHTEALGEGDEVRQRVEVVGDGREVGQHGAPAGRAAAERSMRRPR
jgi:hypothetical protein